MTAATEVTLVHTAGSTAVAGCGVSTCCGLMPMKPTVIVLTVPSAFFATAPFGSVTARVLLRGVTRMLRVTPSAATTLRVMGTPAALRMTLVTSDH